MTVRAPRAMDSNSTSRSGPVAISAFYPTLDHKCNYMPPYVKLVPSGQVKQGETAHSSHWGPTVPVVYARAS
ncbi:unnamed protein product [Penicillium roqueforti FM164]|uniref:Genomic scaffold, ProqFM164S03 n=1 Tax=Penicillium roqueforti (strain FM164) TaxID=1365484 RepID=W6QIT5_PENRF|nr:unnamed protein product [Penicillium roqueforti FM164]